MCTEHTLHFAFEYLDRGWPVIPVNGKTPAVAWAAYQKGRPSVDQIKEWFASSERYNLAVVTGRISELVVVDCDTAESAAWWRRNHPDTPLAVTTGRGGKHFYYRCPVCRVGNKTGILGRQIDIRADGGLVVAPPSIHPETNQAYQWQPWDHYSRDEIPLFELAWLGPARKLSSGLNRTQSESKIRSGLSYIRHITAHSGKGGHNATFRAACKLRDSGLGAHEALDALRIWNKTNAEPPWTEKELAHKVRDAYKEAAS